MNCENDVAAATANCTEPKLKEAEEAEEAEDVVNQSESCSEDRREVVCVPQASDNAKPAGSATESGLKKLAESIGPDQMRRELGLLQDKISALEQKLKQTNCVGFDARALGGLNDRPQLSTSTELHAETTKTTSCKSSQPGLAGAEAGELLVGRYATRGPEPNADSMTTLHRNPSQSSCLSASRAGKAAGPTPSHLMQTKYSSVCKERRTIEERGTRSAIKSNKENVGRITSNVALRLDEGKSQVLSQSRLKSTPLHPPERLRKLQVEASKKKKGETGEQTAKSAQEEHKKTEHYKKEAERWRRKYDILNKQNDKLKADYQELLTNYQTSEQVRKQQRKKIKALQKVPAPVEVLEETEHPTKVPPVISAQVLPRPRTASRPKPKPKSKSKPTKGKTTH